MVASRIVQRRFQRFLIVFALSMITLLAPLTRMGAIEAINPVHDNLADYRVTAIDGTNTVTTFTSSNVPVTGTMKPMMVGSIRGFNNPNAGPIAPRVMPNVERTDVVAIGDGSTPATPTVAAAAPTPTASFQGLHTTVDCIVPPDSDGVVGPTYYAAFVNNNNNCATQTPSGNVGFYCKAASGGACTSQGTLAAAFYYPNLFSGITTNCNLKTTHSDPQVVYDSAKDRYLFVDITTASPFQICIAATLSNDPIGGSYCVASYASLGGSLPDYEKIGVWPDGLYVSYNPSGDSHTVVFNKDDFEACRTIRTQDFDMGSDTHESDNQCTPQPNHIFRPDPATYNIFTGVPSAGEPEFIVSSFCLSGSIFVFTLRVDWSNSLNSLLTRARIVTQTQSFAPSTVASPGNSMDTLRLHTMVPAPYFKDNSGNEYVWTTITTRGSSTSLSAIAWYQFKVVNNAPGSTTVANQNIWNPDSTSRLQAAAAFDRQGDVLMDYSQVSSSVDPAVAYAGRLAGDPVNTLGQTETILFRGPSMGSGACGTQNPCHRWGDYSSNFIDLDGCTFWFTHEYYPGTDVWQWDTRIGATKYSGCTPLTYGRSVSPTSRSFTSSGIGMTTAPQNVTVTNTGTGPLVIQPPAITGTNPGDFSVSSDNCSTAATGIPAGTSCTVQVTCTPSASGSRIAALNIMTNVAAADSTGVSLSCSILSLVAPTISVATSAIDSGQSSTLSTTSSFSGGTSPYTCQWLQKAPGASSYSNFGSSFSCSAGVKPTVSTGTLTTVGTWSFQLQVTDSSGTPLTATSNFVTVTVNPLPAKADTCTTATAGKAFTCTAAVTGGTPPYTFIWTVPAGCTGSSTTSNITITCTTKGSYTISDTVTDSVGNTASSSITVTVSAQTLAITASCTAGAAGKPTTCTASAAGGTAPYTFSWTATAGSPSSGTGSSFSTTFATKGNYTIVATVTDANVKTATQNIPVTVAAQPLVVTVTCPTSGVTAGKPFSCTVSAGGGTSPYSGIGSFQRTEPVKGTFTEQFTVTDANGVSATGSASVTVSAQALIVTVNCGGATAGKPVTCNASATGGTSPYTFSWSAPGASPSTGSGVSFTTAYATKGTFVANATATDVNNVQRSQTASIVVGAQPITVAVTCGNATAGKPVTCSASATGGTPPYAFSWSAPGGSPATGTGASFTTTYPAKGTNVVNATATDANGVKKSATAIVVVAGQPLTASLTASPGVGTSGQPTVFSGSSSGGTTPYMFSWSFGDGSSTQLGSSVAHTYSAPGNYTVVLSVTDANSATASVMQVYRVNAPLPLAVSFTVTNPLVATRFGNFTASASGGVGPYSFSWSFGDNTTGTGISVQHSYSAAPVNYTVTLRVTDSKGSTVTVSQQILVWRTPDLDGDGKVTILDVARVAFAFNTKLGDLNYDPRADLNGDGRINILDIAVVAFYFGTTGW